jgi:drug/metabolite transporter (DMT)-like permease
MSPEHFAIALILAAAFLHAAANALVKASADALLMRGFMSGFSAVVALPFVFFVPALPSGAWPILLASVLVHGLYPFFVAAAYRRGDLSVVFPVARGVSPLGVAVLAVLFGREAAGAAQLAGMVLIAAGVLSIALDPLRLRRAWAASALAFAAATGVVVAGYTYLDAVGLRKADTATSYIVWLLVADGAWSTGLIALVRRKRLTAYVTAHWRRGSAAAALGLLNFGMALYALALGPIVEIAALRETSVVFAAFLGSRVLGEGFARRRMAAAALVLAGIVTTRLP